MVSKNNCTPIAHTAGVPRLAFERDSSHQSKTGDPFDVQSNVENFY
jgi:hypothetical protein